jgi:hypothetical protein
MTKSVTKSVIKPRLTSLDIIITNIAKSFLPCRPGASKNECIFDDPCAKCMQSMKNALAGKEFPGEIRPHSSKDLSDAAITVFGELNPREAKTQSEMVTQQKEAKAIASMIFNRQHAVVSGNIPKGSNFLGSNPNQPRTLSGVVTAKAQFKGYTSGRSTLENFKPDTESCRRQCQRWDAAKAAVLKLARDPSARQPFYFNRAVYQGKFTRTLASGEVRIGHNDFSKHSMGTDM